MRAPHLDACRHEDNLPTALKGVRLLEALCRKAEKEGMQDSATPCIFPLASAMRNLHYASDQQLSELSAPGVEAFRAMTKNHRDNTLKTSRAGGLAHWLAADSSVVAPDMPSAFREK